MLRSITAQPSPPVNASDANAGNENIPQLVKMLESTEVESSAASHKSLPESNVNAANSIATVSNDGDYIDIENNESLPADLLQHVAELLSNDKELQEAMEKIDGNDIIVEDNEQNSPALQNKIFDEKLEKPGTIMEPAPSNLPPLVATDINRMENSFSETNTPNTSFTCSTPNQKEPIKIVRGNGRVITLPPIEAPTTRSRLRAQSTSTPKNNNRSTLKNTTLSTTLNDNSLNVTDTSLEVSRMETQATPSTPANTPKNNSRRKAAVRKTSTRKKKANTDDDDDPNKLWCKCRKPHDNRFMICCDSCEEWFHGDCVNLSKQDGDFLEENAIDWLCEQCQMKTASQKKITDMFPKKVPVGKKNTTTATKNTSKKVAATATNAGATTTNEASKKSNLPLADFKTYVDLGDLICESVRLEAVKKKKIIDMKKAELSKMRNEQLPIDFTGITSTNNKNQSPNSPLPVTAAAAAEATKPTTPTVKIKNKSEEVMDSCIVCKKTSARTDTNFCSDECIRKHAQTAVHVLGVQSLSPSTSLPFDVTSTSKSPAAIADDKTNKKKNKSLFEDCLTQADTTCKIERVPVYNRRTGHTLSGNLAPAKNHFRKWLQDNPGYEVILPGSDKSMELEAKILKKSTSKSPINEQLQKDCKEIPPLVATKKIERNLSMPGTYVTKAITPKPKIYKPVVRSDSEPAEETKSKEKSTPHLSFDNNGSSTSGESIRQVVRRTLIEQISHRLQDEEKRHNDANSEDKLPAMSLEEIEEFVYKVEAEMQRVFQCETNPKYKNKYRSFLFNIKDQSNKTLISRICHKIITPTRLVHMTPAELASQELQKWRENENKHNLEVITKHELDSLKNPNKYVLKSHKGEKVIEKDAMINEFTIEPDVQVKDVCTMLNRSRVLSINKSITTTPTKTGTSGKDEKLEKINQIEMDEKKPFKKLEEKKEKDVDRDREKDNEKSTKERSHHHNDKDKNKDKDKDRHSHHGERSRHKSKDRHRDKARKRSHSPRSRSRSRDKRHKSSSHNKYDRKDNEKQYREKTKEKDNKSVSDMKSLTDTKKSQQQQQKDNVKLREKMEKNLEAFNLVDQIITSRKTVEEAANLVPEKKKLLSTSCPQVTQQLSSPTVSSISSPTIDTPSSTNRVTSSGLVGSSSSAADWDNMPSSSKRSLEDPFAAYMNNTLPPLWRGNVNMVDVTRFELIIQPLVGNCNKIGTLLPSSLEIVGRICPDSVWDYLAKVKNNLNKEIVLLQFLPAKPSENNRYIELCIYLEQRHRLGVLRAASPLIKDFYLMPLLSRSNFPNVLQSMEPIELFNDIYRPHLLIGIAVRVTGSRRHNLSATTLVPELPALPPLPTAANTSSNKNRHEMNTSSSRDSKRRKVTTSESYPNEDDIDVDAIIKAPIVNKVNPAKPPKPVISVPSVGLYDADEPYSPGGSSDDDMPLLPILVTTSAGASASSVAEKTMDIELKRKMDDLNRQIAAQEKEIAGLLVDKSASNVLANISIPSNLSQILASINQNKSETSSPNISNAMARPPIIGSNNDNNNDDAGDEEYNPEDDITYAYSSTKNNQAAAAAVTSASTSSTSRLASLSEAELLSMVPDDMIEQTTTSSSNKQTNYIMPYEEEEEPPPPGV